jgi:nucleotide-binding universal stress UspA family protein
MEYGMSLEVVSKSGREMSADVVQMHLQPAARKRVLCATDLSPRSHRAVARAMLLANQLDAQLTLLHVTDAAEGSDSAICARDELEQQLASTGLPVRRDIRIQLRAGNYVEAIAAFAKESDADIIVLGAQRRRPLESLIGATAERIVALAGRPILSVSLNPRVRYGAVVIAAELSNAFTRVVRIASSLRFLEAQSVCVVHGFESPYLGPRYADGFDVRAAQRNLEAWERAARARLLRSLDAAGVESSRCRIIFQQTRPLRAIQRVVRSAQPDLLIVGTKDRSIFDRTPRGSIARDALRNIDCDVLVASRGSEAMAHGTDCEYTGVQDENIVRH